MTANFYETDRAVAEYLWFHYGSDEVVLPYAFGPADALNYPARCISECLDTARLPANARALDLGCAVGRSTFELARHCTEVIGIDFSHRFVETANQLRERGSLEFAFVEEGELTRKTIARVPEDIDRKRVRFEPGDAMNLTADSARISHSRHGGSAEYGSAAVSKTSRSRLAKPCALEGAAADPADTAALRENGGLGTFDVVLMANLIDRLPDPRRCLNQLPQLVSPGGQLIITSPYTWLTEYTPRTNWLGGFVRDGNEVRTLETLKEILSPAFELVCTKDLPFLIREHARKFQWSVAEASIWRRLNR